MGISMNLEESQSQARSTMKVLNRQIEGYEAVQKSLNSFAYHSEGLSGHAYDSAKAYVRNILVPLTRACILLNEAIITATSALPSRYISEVAAVSLHEEKLLDLIARADGVINYYRHLKNLEYTSEHPSITILKCLQHQIQVQEELKRQLQEKLTKLQSFHNSSLQIFSSIDSLYQAVRQGMTQAQRSWNGRSQTFNMPNKSDLSWTKTVNQQWLDRKISTTSFKNQVDSLTLAELEKKYRNVICARNAYVGPGYDGRYAGLNMSPQEADYIRSRYQLLKNQGQMTLQETEQVEAMFEKLSSKDMAEINAMSLTEIINLRASVLLPRKGLDFAYVMASEQEKARTDYLYYRFEELMAREPIDWRDPQFMEKLNAHINETGINPLTKRPATSQEQLIAHHYGWVKSSSVTAASIIGALIDFSEMTSTTSSTYTADQVSEVLNRHGYTVDDFLKLTDADSVLSPKQTNIVRDIRAQIGLPQQGTRMAKIIPSKYVEGIVSGEFKNFSGFVSVDAHSSALKTFEEVFEGNRLDYHNSPYTLGVDETYAKINFNFDTQTPLEIPLRDPKVEEYPFTGRGFTGSKK